MESVTVVLSAQQLHVVAAALSELPYKVARPVIDAIDQQVQAQLAPTPKPAPLAVVKDEP